MAGFGNKVKLTMLKGMEAVGQRASSMASNAQLKLQELNLETQRREILSEFPLRAYDLWQKGEQLPEPLSKLMESLSDLDERLGVLRAQRYAKVEETKAQKEAPEGTEADDPNAPDGEASDDAQLPEGEPALEDEHRSDDDPTPESEPAATEASASESEPLDEPAEDAPAADHKGEYEADAPMDDGETGDNA